MDSLNCVVSPPLMATVRCTDPSLPWTITLWAPAVRPSTVSGVTPRSVPSIDTWAPLGLDSTWSRPIPDAATAGAALVVAPAVRVALERDGDGLVWGFV